MRLIEAGQGPQVVSEIVMFSRDGRAAKRKALLFALAICVRLTPNAKDPKHLKTRKAAYEAVKLVCRTPTDLFMFQSICKKLSTNGKGYGRAFRRTFADWYLKRDPKELAHLVTKYISREGWSHKDLLRLCHPKAKTKGN